MKVRQGFVSNSSSSSFIIGFAEKPTCAEDVQKALFGHTNGGYEGYYDEQASHEKLAKTVWHDIQQPQAKDITDASDVFDIYFSKWDYKSLDQYMKQGNYKPN